MMKKNNKFYSVFALMSLCFFVSAEDGASFDQYGYVGAKLGVSKFQDACSLGSLNCNDNGIGGGAFVGYKFNPWIGFEFGGTFFEKIDAKYKEGESSVDIFELELSSKLYLPLTDAWSIYSRLGVASFSLETNSDWNGQDDKNTWRPIVGVGVEKKLSNNLSAALEYQFVDGVGTASSASSDLHYININLSYNLSRQHTHKESLNEISYSSYYPTVDKVMLSCNFNFNASLSTACVNLIRNIELTGLKKVFIQGYADNVGTELFNYYLGYERANNIANYFKIIGINENDISIVSHGELEPINKNNNEQGRAENRRVIIELVYEK